jgi:hypothetical protein
MRNENTSIRTGLEIFSLNKKIEENSRNGRNISKECTGPNPYESYDLMYTANETSEDRVRDGKSHILGRNRLMRRPWSETKCS